MKNNELEVILDAEIKKIKKEYKYYGLRFENKNRNVGEIITDCSKHNPDRTDERDFPDYESAEYASLPNLKGISAWRITKNNEWKKSFLYGWNNDMDFSGDAKYAYVIASNNSNTHKTHDPNEIVLCSAVVIAKVEIQ